MELDWPKKTIQTLASECGIKEELLYPYGKFFGKVDLASLELPAKANKQILVTSTTPGKSGIGKTTTSIGLSMALNRLSLSTVATLRQSSLGPTYGRKGGGAGGGAARLQPLDDILMHFTGDFHAITQAHNQLRALIDQSLHFDNPLRLDLHRLLFPRAIDINDRMLRMTLTGYQTSNGRGQDSVAIPCPFLITPASEIMAILALLQGRNQAEVIDDLYQRLDKITLGYDQDGELIPASSLGVTGAIAALLRHAISPNLTQTCEGTPALLHAGPFANIAHGCSSILADQVAARFFDCTITEAGFGADLGFEKFWHIKCRVAKTSPALAVLTTTLGALREQSVRGGADNLEHHLGVLRSCQVPTIVAVNVFPGDSAADLANVCRQAESLGALKACPIQPYTKGSEGCMELAQWISTHWHQLSAVPWKPVYVANASLKDKVSTVARVFYGQEKISFSESAVEQMKELPALAQDLPICIAKTPLSLSHDPKIYKLDANEPLPISSVQPAFGAGFIIVNAGQTPLMPALGREPQAKHIKLQRNGAIKELF
jgi:formate--tetrahydrofolate ligase